MRAVAATTQSMIEEMTVEECRSFAKRAGLNLCDEELGRLLPGINRAKRQAAELRELIDSGAEPVLTFAAARSGEK
jgi:hypothetical protein